MNPELNFYCFTGSPELEKECRFQFVPDADMTATVGDVVLSFGSFGVDRPGVLVESAGETAFIVSERFVDPFPPDAFRYGEDY